MAVEFVAVADSGYAARTGAVTVAAPSGVEDGDLLLMMVVLGNSGGGAARYPDTPSGWTEFADSPSTVTDPTPFTLSTSLFWRVAASEPADYTVNYEDFSLPSEAVVLAYRGAVGVEPEHTIATGFGDTTTMAGMTAEVDGTRFVYVAHDWRASGGFSPPGGTTPTWTERHDSAGSLLYAADGVLDSGESTGDDTQTTNNGNLTEPWTAVLVKLTPEGAVISASIDATESGSDTAEVSASVLVSGALAADESGSDTASIAGGVVVSGALAATETGADSASIAGSVVISAHLAATETGQDTARILSQPLPYSPEWAYAVPAASLRIEVSAANLDYVVPADGLGYAVPADGLQYVVDIAPSGG